MLYAVITLTLHNTRQCKAITYCYTKSFYYNIHQNTEVGGVICVHNTQCTESHQYYWQLKSLKVSTFLYSQIFFMSS